ncbi:MAG: T9SS type A sorting domain-containing protein, partial [Flavobacteriales bacterium]
QDTMIIDYVRIYQEPRVSISEFKTSSPVFFPNPVNDELNIETTFSGKEIVLLNLFSIDGKLIKSYEQNIQQNKIKINGMNTLPKGLYFLNYKIENKNYTIKFVKS